MKKIGIRIPLNFRLWLFAILLVSWCTGIAFFVLSKWVTVEGEFGPEKHPWQFPVLKVHGAAAFLMMITYGIMLGTHVPTSWKQKRQKRMGLALVIAQGFIIVTAYLLYYAAADTFRLAISYAHASTGFIFPFLLAWHIFHGVKTRRQLV